MANEKNLNDKSTTGQNRQPEKEERSQPVNAIPHKTEVKNTHAAGDGAMGPNETPLPDLEEKTEHEAPEEPPY